MAQKKKKSSKKVDGRLRPERKIEILKGVMTLLEKGNRKVTTADLAKEVGLSEAALYRHFKSKAAIFEALTDYIADHLLKPVDQLNQSPDTPLSQLRRLFDYHMGFFTEHPGLCRVFLVEGVITRQESEGMVKVVDQYAEQIRGLLEKGRESGELAADLDPAPAARLFIGIIQSTALDFVMSGFNNKPNQQTSALWSLFERAVGRPA